MKARRKIGIVRVLLCAFFLQGCANKTSSLAETAQWQIPEENRLIVYTSHKEDVYAPVVKEFEERTGIFVEVKQGGTLELFNQIAQEAGCGTCDVMFGGGIDNFTAYEEYLEAYEVAEVQMIDENYRCPNHKWTTFSVIPIVFIYNTKLVDAYDAPEAWKEFQTSRWKGKVAFADPAGSGSSYTALCTMIQALDADEESIISNFVDVLDGYVSESSSAVLEEVNNGSKLVGITLEETAKKEMAKGADIAITYPQDGTSAIPDATAIIKGAPHLENAQKFLDFTVSEDVQTLLNEKMYRESVRIDKKGEKDTGEETKKVIDYDIAWVVEKKDSLLRKWVLLQKDRNEKLD